MTSLAKFCGVDGSYKYYEDTGYRDISADSPLAPYVKWARDAGLMDGSNGSFLPDEKLTREQMATVVARYLTALGLASMDTAQTSYKDDARISAWAKSGVALCTQEGILQGSNGSFLPKGKLTRAQFVKLLACSLADAETLKTYEGKHPFKDSEDHWAEAYIAWAKDKGIVEGVSATEFDPEAPITREQMATIFGRYALKQGIELPKSDNAAGSFPDADKISEYAMRIAGILNGYEDGTFRPQGNATRAEAAKLFSLFLSITDKLAK